MFCITEPAPRPPAAAYDAREESVAAQGEDQQTVQQQQLQAHVRPSRSQQQGDEQQEQQELGRRGYSAEDSQQSRQQQQRRGRQQQEELRQELELQLGGRVEGGGAMEVEFDEVSIFPVGASASGAAASGGHDSIHDSRPLPDDLESRLDALLQSFQEQGSRSSASRAAAGPTAGGGVDGWGSGFPRLHHEDDEFLPAMRSVHQSSSGADAASSVSFSNSLPPLQQDFRLDYSDAGAFQWLRDGTLPATAAAEAVGAVDGEEAVPGSPASSYDERALGWSGVSREDAAFVAAAAAARRSGGEVLEVGRFEVGTEVVQQQQSAGQQASQQQQQGQLAAEEDDDDPFGMFSISRRNQPTVRPALAGLTVLTRPPQQQRQQPRAPSLMESVAGDPYDMFGFRRRQASSQSSGAPRHPAM